MCASDVISSSFATHEAVSAFGNFVVGQRSAIVDLGISRGRKRDFTLFNLERAVVGCVLVVRVGGLYLIIDRTEIGDARNRVGPSLTVVCRILNGRAIRHARRGAAFVGFTIILAAVIDGLDSHGRLLDGQRARLVSDSVVAGRLTNDGGRRDDFVRVGAGIGLAARQRDAGQSIGTLESLNRNVSIDARSVGSGRTLSLTVIGVFLILSSDGEFNRGDLQFKITFGARGLDGVARGLAGKRYLNGAGVLADVCSLGCRNAYSCSNTRRQTIDVLATDFIFDGVIFVLLFSAVVFLRRFAASHFNFNINRPNCIEVMVGRLLVCCDVGRFIGASFIGVELAVLIPKEVHGIRSRCTFLGPRPTNEGMTFVCERGFRIDLHARIVRNVVARYGRAVFERVRISAG